MDHDLRAARGDEKYSTEGDAQMMHASESQ